MPSEKFLRGLLLTLMVVALSIVVFNMTGCAIDHGGVGRLATEDAAEPDSGPFVGRAAPTPTKPDGGAVRPFEGDSGAPVDPPVADAQPEPEKDAGTPKPDAEPEPEPDPPAGQCEPCETDDDCQRRFLCARVTSGVPKTCLLDCSKPGTSCGGSFVDTGLRCTGNSILNMCRPTTVTCEEWLELGYDGP